MRSIYRYRLLFAAVLTLQGCTHNDGGPHELYGQWKLMSMEKDGINVPGYTGNIFWSFQSSTIEMKEVKFMNEVSRNFGNFRLTDQTLYLSFPYDDFIPPVILGLPREAEMEVVSLKGSEMILSYGTPATFYTFHRW